MFSSRLDALRHSVKTELQVVTHEPENDPPRETREHLVRLVLRPEFLAALDLNLDDAERLPSLGVEEPPPCCRAPGEAVSLWINFGYDDVCGVFLLRGVHRGRNMSQHGHEYALARRLICKGLIGCVYNRLRAAVEEEEEERAHGDMCRERQAVVSRQRNDEHVREREIGRGYKVRTQMDSWG